MTRLPKPALGPWGSGYGWRTLRNGVRNFHNGRDLQWLLRDPAGSQRVYAPVSGRVLVSSNALVGTFVSLPMGDGFSTRLCHFASVAVLHGQHVTRGQYLGRMGDTGSQAEGIHLHVDVFDPSGNRRDPAEFYGDTFVGALTPSTIGTPVPVPPRKVKEMYLLRTAHDGAVMLVTSNGMAHITKIEHLTLLSRLLRTEPGGWDTFNSDERHIIAAYIHAANTADDDDTARILEALAGIQVDTGAVVAAVRDAIEAQGVVVDFGAVLAAIESVNANINDQPTEFVLAPRVDG